MHEEVGTRRPRLPVDVEHGRFGGDRGRQVDIGAVEVDLQVVRAPGIGAAGELLVLGGVESRPAVEARVARDVGRQPS